MSKIINYFSSKKNNINRGNLQDKSIRVKNLYAIYDEKQENQTVALNNISYDFDKNKIYFIIGNSGSGKSTLVTHFNGLLVSKYGYVQVNDIVAGDHFNLDNKLIAVLDNYDYRINDIFNKHQLDSSTFVVLFSYDITKHQAKILFEAQFKEKVKNLYFVKQYDPKLISNSYLRANSKIAIVKIDKNVLLNIKNKLGYDQLQQLEYLKTDIKTNPKISKKIRRFKELRKKVGFVFQFPEYQLFKETIEKDIMFGPINLGIKKQEAKIRAKKYLNLLGMGDEYLERSPFGLSGGQKRRVAIAGILAIDTDSLVFDEPTAGLDPVGEQEMMNIILDAKKRGKTVFVITHTMEHVLEVADEVIVMDQGEIIKTGSPYEIFFDDYIINSTSIQVPRVIAVIKQLITKDDKYKLLIDKKPKTVEELAEAIADLKKKGEV